MLTKALLYRQKAIACLEKTDWIPPLLARISVGWVFFESGWGKLNNLSNVVDFFTQLGIPFPQVQAPFVAFTEFACGILLIAGLLTRLAAIPLIGTMVVAIATAKREELSAVSDLFGFSEYLYIVLLVWLVWSGPGRVSVDCWLLKKSRA